MKKTSFLKGLAMAAVAFGAMFTSCTEEDFNVKVTPNNAKIYFNPTVIDPIANATVEATITGAETITGTPSIAAGSVTISAKTANGSTGSVTVNYDAVEAGNTATYSPIIYLSGDLFTLVENKKVDVVYVTSAPINGNVTAPSHVSHDKTQWLWNKSDYTMKFKAEWNETATAKYTITETFENSTQLQSYVKGLSKEFTAEGSETFVIAPWEAFSTEYTITEATITYNVVSVENNDFIVAEVEVTNPIYKVEVAAKRQAIPGHEGHWHNGHAHSHGESTNAGGGIGWAE